MFASLCYPLINLYLYINTPFPIETLIRNASKGVKPSKKNNHYGFRSLYKKSINEENSKFVVKSRKTENEGRNIKSEKCQDYSQKSQWNCSYFHGFHLIFLVRHIGLLMFILDVHLKKIDGEIGHYISLYISFIYVAEMPTEKAPCTKKPKRQILLPEKRNSQR